MNLTEEQIQELRATAQPLVDYINRYGHPHCTIIVTNTSAELVEGVAAHVFTPPD